MRRNFISFLIIIFGSIYLYQNNYIQELIIDYKKEIIIPAPNEYEQQFTFSYAQNTTNFRPQTKTDLINIYYTVINSGWDEFTFYCGDEYKHCIKHVAAIAADDYFLSHLNSFVHPYNSYKHLYTTYNPDKKKVTLTVLRNYDDYFIEIINEKINNVITEIIDPNTSIKDQIKVIHDYIINTNEYDVLKLDNIDDNTYQSNLAYGPLFQGYAVCSGFTDTMALFLTKLGVPNFKIATSNHVWNLVYLDQEWLHLDLTWDSPLSEKKLLLHNYFLINTKQLLDYNDKDHNFDSNIYQEVKKEQ